METLLWISESFWNKETPLLVYRICQQAINRPPGPVDEWWTRL
ncbi:hypothetical protein MAR_026407 [Mya arenaria]|uniref:Uncharacterized protein n=1 Tax=Mya arenaria TaxID=6604 RepID=A0ABY7EST6_MYAAR|nr:hypothetical protein MAR_026407 [Mya arenaria]